MKRIRYEEKFRSATGQPFYIPDPDVGLQKKAREDAFKEARQAVQDKRQPIPTLTPQVEATFASLVTWFVDNIPHAKDDEGKPERKVSITDSGNAYAVVRAFHGVQDGYVELESLVHQWLLDTIDLDGIHAFGAATMAANLKERVQDLITDKSEATPKG